MRSSSLYMVLVLKLSDRRRLIKRKIGEHWSRRPTAGRADSIGKTGGASMRWKCFHLPSKHCSPIRSAFTSPDILWADTAPGSSAPLIQTNGLPSPRAPAIQPLKDMDLRMGSFLKKDETKWRTPCCAQAIKVM